MLKQNILSPICSEMNAKFIGNITCYHRAVPEGCKWYQHHVVLGAVQTGGKGRDCCCTNTLAKNRKAKPGICIPNFAEGNNPTGGKHLGKLPKLHSNLWQLYNTTSPQTWPCDKVTTPDNFLKKLNSIKKHQIAFFLDKVSLKRLLFPRSTDSIFLHLISRIKRNEWEIKETRPSHHH